MKAALLRLLHALGLYTRRDVDAGWTDGFLHGARGKGVINDHGRWRPFN